MGNVLTQTIGSKITPFDYGNNNGNNDNSDNNQCVICLDTMEKGLYQNKENIDPKQLFVKCFVCNLTVHYICEQQWLHDKNFVKCIQCQNIGTGYVSTTI